ncbi:MAG: hypothetical protein WCK29_03245 [archaeon]
MEIKNKKGALGNQIMIFEYIFILMVVSVGFFVGISAFFGQSYDFRQTQADLLSYKISDCLNQNENMDFNNFFSVCGLNKELLEKNNLDFKICDSMDFSNCASASAKVSVGSNFELCFLTGASNNDKYPKCSLKNINSKYALITMVNQKPKEVTS